MSAVGRSPRIEIPRWIQLVGLPLLLVLAWLIADGERSRRLPVPGRRADRAAARHARRGAAAAAAAPRPLGRVRVPQLCRGGRPASSCRDRHRSSSRRRKLRRTGSTTTSPMLTAPSGQTSADRDVDRLQVWLNQHHLKSIKIQKRGHKLVTRDPSARRRASTRTASSRSSRAPRSRSARRCSRVVLLLVMSIYMLLDLPRLGRTVDRRFPPRPASSR